MSDEDTEIRRNVRVGVGFSTSPLPPVPLVGIEFPTRGRWSTSFYLTGQPKDAYVAASLRPQIEFFRSSRFRLGVYAEGGGGYFFYGTRGPSSSGGGQILVGMGAEGCFRITPEHGACLSAGYSAAWIERTVYTSPSSVRPDGWDGRNLLSIGFTLSLGL